MASGREDCLCPAFQKAAWKMAGWKKFHPLREWPAAKEPGQFVRAAITDADLPGQGRGRKTVARI